MGLTATRGGYVSVAMNRSERETSRLPRPSHVLLRSRLLLATALFFAVALGVIAALAPSWLLEIDRPISDAVRDVGDPTFWKWVTRLGSARLAVAFAVIGLGIMWNRCRAFAVTLPAIVGVGIGVDVLVKLVVDRARPDDPLVGTSLGSFPSGHVVQSVMLLGLLPPILWILTRRRWAFWGGAALLLTGVPAVALSRIALGAHWPSDVIASFFIGAGLLLGGEYFIGSGWGTQHCSGHPQIHAGEGRRTGFVKSRE